MGATRLDWAKTANPVAGWKEPTAPPCTTSLGSPPAAGMVYRFSAPSLAAVNQIVLPSGEKWNSSTDRSGDSNRVCFAPEARS